MKLEIGFPSFLPSQSYKRNGHNPRLEGRGRLMGLGKCDSIRAACLLNDGVKAYPEKRADIAVTQFSSAIHFNEEIVSRVPNGLSSL